jgi:hypothetical protein
MTSESRPETEQGNSAGGGPATATSVNESKPPAGGETFPAANAKDCALGRGALGSRMPMFLSVSSAVRQLVTHRKHLPFPPHRHAQTSTGLLPVADACESFATLSERTHGRGRRVKPCCAYLARARAPRIGQGMKRVTDARLRSRSR